MLYISCSTFNHVGYIKDAMNGFAMQQTQFPFVAVIMDDASTDGTKTSYVMKIPTTTP